MGGALRPWHLIVLLIVLILVFGASKLPEIAKNIGQSAKVMKKEMRELTEDDQPKNPQIDQAGTDQVSQPQNAPQPDAGQSQNGTQPPEGRS
ncbi:MAG: Sec-independent protein translocase subunit TatA [Actinomycetaceae bacterium]|nr:Sec-independent protein translocase subunit TatA [Actinomycetaceae bacterium]